MPLTGSGMVGHMASMIYGYARISTNDQTTSLQKDALEKAGCDRIFTDVASGAKAHRPELDHMLDLLREGDMVVVWKLDRLGRSMQNLVDLMTTFDERECSSDPDRVDRYEHSRRHARIQHLRQSRAVRT